MADEFLMVVRHFVERGDAHHYTRTSYGAPYTGGFIGLPITIGQAMRNYLTKGWEVEVLALYNRPKGMPPDEWGRITSDAWNNLVGSQEQGDGL